MNHEWIGNLAGGASAVESVSETSKMRTRHQTLWKFLQGRDRQRDMKKRPRTELRSKLLSPQTVEISPGSGKKMILPNAMS